MPTKLDKTIKREVEIEGKPYTVAIAPEGLKITPKGARKGQEITWASLLNTESGTGAGGGASSGFPPM